MIHFIAQKLLNKKWLILCILIGNVLLVAIASCNPMYTKAALQKMLTTKMDNYIDEEQKYPGLLTVDAVLYQELLEQKVSSYFDDYTKVEDKVRELYGIEPTMQVRYFGFSQRQSAHYVEKRENNAANSLYVKPASLTGIEEQVTFLSGEMYASTANADGSIDVIVNEPVYFGSTMVVGEKIELDNLRDINGNPVTLRIAGVFRAKDASDIYWAKSPLSYDLEMFMDPALFMERFANGTTISGNVTGRWYTFYDYEKISTDSVEGMLETDNRLIYDYKAQPKGVYRITPNYHKVFEDFQKNSGRVVTTMWILQSPILVLLAVFIFMVSNQVISIEQGEISILKSRGVSKLQLILTYLIQSAILAAIGLVIGIPIGYLLCHLFGSTNAFLEFVGRKAMHVSITGTAFLYGLVVSLLSIVIMTLPVLKYARFTIVEQKANKRKKATPLWQRVWLDVILLAASLYGFYNFNSQKELLVSKVASGKALDPMLFLSASMFILSCAIVFLRIIPLLATVVFKIGRKLLSPAAYASFLQIMRDIRKQSFITVFLVLTIALGIFNANIARTVNKNEEIRIHYNTGADIVLSEKWKDNSGDMKMGYSGSLLYEEPDFHRYELLKEAHSDTFKGLAKVLRDTATVNSTAADADPVQFLAINTYDFGNTAWMPDGVTPEHWYTYLNALAVNPEGAIISSNFAQKMNFKVGSTISVYRKDSTGKPMGRMPLTVVAIMDAFPSFEAKQTSVSDDGTVTTTESYLVVCNYANLSRYYPVTPYQVWMKIDGDADFLYDWAEENNITFSSFENYSDRIVAMKNDPYFQVTNGMLTISFIVILVLCAIGFLIYWLTSIRARELIFGIYRAMGMSMGELIRMLLNEHFFGSVIPILFGAGVGILASKMFIPLIEIAYAPAEQTLPTGIFINSGDIIRISVVVGVMLIGCLAVISVMLSKMKINQALKLGED